VGGNLRQRLLPPRTFQPFRIFSVEPDTYLDTVTSTGLGAKCQLDMAPQTQALLAVLPQALSDGDKATESLLPLARRHCWARLIRQALWFGPEL